MFDLSKCRESVAARLRAEGADDLAEPLEECGLGFELICLNCGTGKPCVKRCKKRWCPSCARFISLERISKYQAVIDSMRWPMLVTLTMPHTLETSCPSDVRKLRRALGKLRRLRWFKRCVRGGITSIEVTGGANGWHPHAHMLIDCRWFAVQVPEPRKGLGKEGLRKVFKAARAEVADQWALCLHEDRRLQVSISRARPDAAREVLKYAVKPTELADSPLPLAPLLRILSVSRLVSAFGSVRADRLEALKGQLEEEDERVSCLCGCQDFRPDWIIDNMRSHGHSVTKACARLMSGKWE